MGGPETNKKIKTCKKKLKVRVIPALRGLKQEDHASSMPAWDIYRQLYPSTRDSDRLTR